MNHAPESGGLLIGGSSLTGKTTLARRLEARLGWQVISTDGMARHPGRPWPEVPPAVAEHYVRLSPEAIHWFLGVHHQNMWPGIRQLIRRKRPLLCEGSALRPELLAPDLPGDLRAVFLIAPDEMLRARIHAASDHAALPADRRALVDAFLDRALRDNRAIAESARDCGLPCIDISAPDEFAAFLAETLGLQH